MLRTFTIPRLGTAPQKMGEVTKGEPKPPGVILPNPPAPKEDKFDEKKDKKDLISNRYAALKDTASKLIKTQVSSKANVEVMASKLTALEEKYTKLMEDNNILLGERSQLQSTVSSQDSTIKKFMVDYQALELLCRGLKVAVDEFDKKIKLFENDKDFLLKDQRFLLEKYNAKVDLLEMQKSEMEKMRAENLELVHNIKEVSDLSAQYEMEKEKVGLDLVQVRKAHEELIAKFNIAYEELETLTLREKKYVERFKEYENCVRDLNGKVVEKDGVVCGLESELERVNGALEVKNQVVSELNEQIVTIRNNLTLCETQLANLKQSDLELSNDFNEMKEVLAEKMKEIEMRNFELEQLNTKMMEFEMIKEKNQHLIQMTDELQIKISQKEQSLQETLLKFNELEEAYKIILTNLQENKELLQQEKQLTSATNEKIQILEGQLQQNLVVMDRTNRENVEEKASFAKKIQELEGNIISLTQSRDTAGEDCENLRVQMELAKEKEEKLLNELSSEKMENTKLRESYLQLELKFNTLNAKIESSSKKKSKKYTVPQTPDIIWEDPHPSSQKPQDPNPPSPTKPTKTKKVRFTFSEDKPTAKKRKLKKRSLKKQTTQQLSPNNPQITSQNLDLLFNDALFKFPTPSPTEE